MATTSHTIYSHYDPADRERLEIETGQTRVVDEQSWALEATAAFPRRLAPPPRFVPASKSYEFGSEQASSLSSVDSKTRNDVSVWYSSLTRRSDSRPELGATPAATEMTIQPKAAEQPTKNNWFILNALKSQQPQSLSSKPPPTLADLLERDPPPRSSEAKFKPPVWLAIGPSNKGFTMLERSGWCEGEPLGPDFIRRQKKGKAKETECRQTISVPFGNEDDGIWQVKQVSTIDLTLSDPDSDDERPDSFNFNHEPADDSPYARKALITPIATVLKSDRLGIGLKAKTTGPYKESVKRVTHSTAALMAHAKASEDLKRWTKSHGRGQRGFAKQRRHEEEQRRAMIAYLNS